MAEAIARYDAADVMEASSAGLHPLGYIADLTKQTLTKNGYSANGLTSDLLTRESTASADLIISSPLLSSGYESVRPTFGERDPYEIISADE